MIKINDKYAQILYNYLITQKREFYSSDKPEIGKQLDFNDYKLKRSFCYLSEKKLIEYKFRQQKNGHFMPMKIIVNKMGSDLR